MAILSPPKAVQREGLQGFLGANLRRNRLDLADHDFARAVNCDLHRQPGVALVRLGRTAAFVTPLGAAIRRLATLSGRQYQVAGTTLYANQVSILTGLSGSLFTTLQPFRPLNDTTEWVYIADSAAMRAHDGTTVRNWGIAAPAAVPTLAAGSATGLTGTYTAVYTYVRVVGTSIALESDASPIPAALTLADQKLDLTTVASTDAQVTNIRIYRTAANGSVHLFDQQVGNTSATFSNFQTDTALGSALELDNAVPNAMSWVTAFQGHLFLCRDAANPHYLWWSKRFREEVPAGNFLEIGSPTDPLQGAFPMAGFLGVFSRRTKYRVAGNQTSGFAWLEALSSRGTPAAGAAIVTAKGVLFPARDGLFLTNFLQEDTELSQAIEPLFSGQRVHDFAPIDWARASEMALAEYKDRYYFSYPHTDGGNLVAVFSKDTQRWYHFDYGVDLRALAVDETADTLLGGGTAGVTYVLEDAVQSDAGQNISLELEPATRVGGDRYTQKLFQYWSVDVDAQGGSVTATLLVDDVIVATLAITGTRTRQVKRLPPRLLGSTWRVRVTYAGQEAVAIHGVQVWYLMMRSL